MPRDDLVSSFRAARMERTNQRFCDPVFYDVQPKSRGFHFLLQEVASMIICDLFLIEALGSGKLLAMVTGFCCVKMEASMYKTSLRNSR